MRKKVEYLWLVVTGLVLVFVAVYMQWVSMDLSRYSIAEYAANDLNQLIWWKAIGFPFLVGGVYLGIAIFGSCANLDNKKTVILFAICFAVGCLLSVATDLGYFAAIVMAACLMYVILAKKHESL